MRSGRVPCDLARARPAGRDELAGRALLARGGGVANRPSASTSHSWVVPYVKVGAASQGEAAEGYEAWLSRPIGVRPSGAAAFGPPGPREIGQPRPAPGGPASPR